METKPLRILLVEDDHSAARLMEEFLRDAMWTAYELTCANRLASALEALEAGGVDLVLLDLVLPDSQGFDTFSRVRAAAPQVALIVLSGTDDEALALRMVQSGAQDYLVKGRVDVQGLVRAMRYAWERQQAELALARERQLLRTLIDNLPDYIFVKDPASRFVLNNAAHLRVLRAAAQEEVLGKSDFDIFPRELADGYFADEQAVMDSGKPLVNREEVGMDPAGKHRHLLTTKVPLRDPAGHGSGLVGISRDITDLKEAEEKLRAHAAEIQRDLQIAREFQEALMPRDYPQVPANPAAGSLQLGFHHFYQPALSVGGDFFDIVKLGDHRAGVFVADVMGHGAHSALVTAILRALWQDLVHQADDPGHFLTLINQHFAAVLARTNEFIFASAFYLVLDTRRAQAVFASAGHPPPLLASRATRRIEPLLRPEDNKPALGLMNNTRYNSFTRPVAADDLFLLYTDGIVEAPNAAAEEFGHKRLRGAIERSLDLPLEELTHAVLRAINEFIGPVPLPDDICLVATEVAAVGATRAKRPVAVVPVSER
ncbi:MAG: SpoIIE family protein phosphatase [Verrucomicrobia bacterium]|nr:SpoIIE family protein phosphatase [Verrucomicrobiota bacterium]